jgi:hypothetical protein
MFHYDPNATYLISKIDFDFWNLANSHVSTVFTEPVLVRQMSGRDRLCQ